VRLFNSSTARNFRRAAAMVAIASLRSVLNVRRPLDARDPVGQHQGFANRLTIHAVALPTDFL
jgi:hypothetical protein